MGDRHRGHAHRQARRRSGRGCWSMPPGPWVDHVIVERSARTTPTMCGWSRAATSSSARSSSTTARLLLPERRRPHHLRHPLRGRLHADRHHRPGLSRRSGGCGDRARRDRLSLRRGQRIFRGAGDDARISSGPIPASARCSTTAPAKAQEATRDYVLKVEGDAASGAAGQCVRRQADHVSTAVGGGAGKDRGRARQQGQAMDGERQTARRRISPRRVLTPRSSG